MTPRVQPDRTGASASHSHHPSGQKAAGGITLHHPLLGYPPSLRGVSGGTRRPLLGALLALALGLGAAAPARAATTIISSAVQGPLTVNSGDVLEISFGGSVDDSTESAGNFVPVITVNAGGTLNIFGGSVSIADSTHYVTVNAGGTMTISGGSLSAPQTCVNIAGGTLNLTAGSLTSTFGEYSLGVSAGALNMTGGSVNGGIAVSSGTAAISGGSVNNRYDFAVGISGSATISGCDLRLTNSGGLQRLTGTLLDGSSINTLVYGVTLDSGEPQVTTNPTSQTVCAGQTASFTAAASGDSAPIVQWQVSTDGGKTFNDYTGFIQYSVTGRTATTTYSFTPTMADSGNQYRAHFSYRTCDSVTTSASLTVNTAPFVTTQPTSQTGCAGDLASFTAAASGTPAPTVQWQVSTDGGKSFSDATSFGNIQYSVSGGTATSTYYFGTTAADSGKQYRAVFSNATCADAATNPASLTVTGLVITTQPTDQMVCAGHQAVFTAAATSTPAPTVQWRVSTDGGKTYNDIQGATSPTLSFLTTAADNGKLYRADFINPCVVVETSPATLTVNAAPTVTTQPTSQTVCAGQSVTFTAAASGTPAPIVEWQVSTDGGSSFHEITGATNPTYSFTPTADSGTQYRAQFFNLCDSPTTTAVSLTVNAAPVITTQPTSQTVCAGHTVTFTAAANGTPAPPVQWQMSADGGKTFFDVPGATSSTYSFTPEAGDNGEQWRASFVNSCGMVKTTAAGLTVDTSPPSITTSPAAQSAPADDHCQAAVPDFTGGVVASGNCSAVTITQSLAAGTLVGRGAHTITLTATDAALRSSTCTTSFTVADAAPPVVTLNGSSSMTVECHSSFADPGANANDVCVGSTPVTISGSVDPNRPGTYTLTYTATDPSGNTAAATRTVNVVDTTPPVVTPPATITQAADAGQCSARLNPGTAAATDSCAGALTPVGTRSDGKALTAPYPVGTTSITWTATDPAGNKAAASQTVTVLDQQPPTISCPGDMTVPATSTSGAAVSFTVGASDNCPGVSASSTPPSGSLFPLGPTTVSCKVTGAHGNTATGSFTVTVVPAADLSLAMSASPGPAVNDSSLTYTLVVRNAGPQAAQSVVLTDPLPAGTSFASASRSPNSGTLTTPKGSGTVTWNVGTLASGQSATLTVVVKVSAKAGATINNIAGVSSSSPLDPNPGNNSAAVSSTVAKH